ncbi:pyridoxal phosphate-dependent aminotransferase [Cryptosporangium phraense]|uniref:Pyridoxal phosphate-dependent aminotransferase n=2 Tax=Cryptosporangium phraense TaxID=2593070 RepID=A0A545AMJ0_9ACTN|nr:pyridoxal phosphate-dependent aminotransferase [Cryptosporangium phraense]
MASLIDASVRYDLAESTCPPLTTDELGPLPALSLGYGTTRGPESLRALIAAETGVSADQVLVTAGAQQALSLVASLLSPGDGVVLLTPCFPPARSVPEAIGARVDVVPLSFDDGYRMPLDRVASALRPDTRLVSLASPQNPSGVRFTEEELGGLLAAVSDRAPEAVVLVDETYRSSSYSDASPARSAAGLSPRVVTCSSLSKAHGAPGLRTGWLTAPDADLYVRLQEAKFRSTVASSTVDSFLAEQVLRRQASILATRASRLRAALDVVVRWAAGQPVEIVVPDGGALCCLRIDRVGEFYSRLTALDTRVAPGSWFGDDDRVFRVGFGHLPIEDLVEALDRVGLAISS